MRILYIHQYFAFPDEGGSTRSYDLAKSFVQKDYEIVVLSATSDERLKGRHRWNIIRRDGIQVQYIYLPYNNGMSYLKRSLVFFKFLWFTSFRTLRIKTDIVLATSTPLTIGIPALIKKWFNKTPYIFEVRDVWPEVVIAVGAVKNKFLQKLLYKLEKVIYRNASIVVPLSVDMQKSIITRYPKFLDKSRVVIPNISEINRFQINEGGIDLKEKIGFNPRFSILYAGTFGKVNGIEYVVHLATKTLEVDPNLVYILIGKGAEKENIIQLAKNRKVLNKNVFIFDPIAKKELSLWYASVSMGSSFVIDIKELWANSANKFFDTLAASRPILINHGGWQETTIRNKNVGYVLPCRLSKMSASDFVNYTKDAELHRKQSVNALHLAKEEYSLEVAIDKYDTILNSILNV